MLEFVNTHADGGGRIEQFGDAAGLRGWLDRIELPEEVCADGGDLEVTGADAASARELRDALVTVLLAHAGEANSLGEPLTQAESYLQRVTRRYPLTSLISAEGATLRASQSGVPGVLASVLAGITELALSGAWSRVKACRNQPCHFGFFDRTRNSSAAFCGPGCASQASMRAYRQRKKNAAAR
ncbi:MAG: ABATE domain-containing protein [Pseudonocardia sp.]|nr:ABATE domain-containing protein [Pseudonocardia sp.]